MATGRKKEIIEALRELMAAQALSQTDVCRKLGVTQGHLSKVLNGSQRLSPKLRLRILEEFPSREEPQRSRLEGQIADALRKSPEFRVLVMAALKLVGRR